MPHYCITFDSWHAERVRRTLETEGYREGKHYRIGMAEERHQLGVRCLPAANETLLRLTVERALNIR